MHAHRSHHLFICFFSPFDIFQAKIIFSLFFFLLVALSCRISLLNLCKQDSKLQNSYKKQTNSKFAKHCQYVIYILYLLMAHSPPQFPLFEQQIKFNSVRSNTLIPLGLCVCVCERICVHSYVIAAFYFCFHVFVFVFVSTQHRKLAMT